MAKKTNTEPTPETDERSATEAPAPVEPPALSEPRQFPEDLSDEFISVQGETPYLPYDAALYWFREEHPDWGIQTECTLLEWDGVKGHAVYKADIYGYDNQGQWRHLASGSKSETSRGFADFQEKAESGAIQRALNVLGYGTAFALKLSGSPMVRRGAQRPTNRPAPQQRPPAPRPQPSEIDDKRGQEALGAARAKAIDDLRKKAGIDDALWRKVLSERLNTTPEDLAQVPSVIKGHNVPEAMAKVIRTLSESQAAA